MSVVGRGLAAGRPPTVKVWRSPAGQDAGACAEDMCDLMSRTVRRPVLLEVLHGCVLHTCEACCACMASDGTAHCHASSPVICKVNQSAV